MGPAAGRSDDFVAEVVRDAEEFSALAGEWSRLYRSSPHATPFQAHGWLDSWWRAYACGGRLRVVLVRDRDGRLLAAAPLYLRWRAGVRILAPLGGAISDFVDVLVAEDSLAAEEVPAVLSALTAGLLEAGDWDVVDLPEVRRDAAAQRLLGAWPGPRWSLGASTCMEVHACNFADFLKRLSGKRAGEVRRRLRRADELGLVVTEVPGDQAGEAVTDLIRLHTRQWEGRRINPEHLRGRFARHLAGALATMICERRAVLTEYRLEGSVVAVTLDLVGHDMLCGYLMGVAPALYKKMDVTAYVLRREADRMSECGISTFSMLRGREAYKERWRPVVVPNQRLIMGRPGSVRALLFACAALARARAVAAARGRRARLQRLARWAHPPRRTEAARTTADR